MLQNELTVYLLDDDVLVIRSGQSFLAELDAGSSAGPAAGIWSARLLAVDLEQH